MELKNPFGPESWFRQLGNRLGAFRHQASLHKRFLRLIGRGSDPRTPGKALNLFELWGDPLEPARQSYVRSCLQEFEKTEGPVLLSSAGLMTLLLGAVSAGDKTRTIWCLEQSPHWTNVLRAWLKRYGIKRTYIITAPPIVKTGTVRYRIEARHLPKNIRLVLCDAPNASVGSALSTLLVVGPNLAPDFTVFARTIKISEDGPLLRRWALKYGATFVVVNKRDGFVKISRRENQRASVPEKATFIVDTA